MKTIITEDNLTEMLGAILHNMEGGNKQDVLKGMNMVLNILTNHPRKKLDKDIESFVFRRVFASLNDMVFKRYDKAYQKIITAYTAVCLPVSVI